MAEGYPTDLTEAEEAVLEPLLSAAKLGGRPRTTSLRRVVEAIFYARLRSASVGREIRLRRSEARPAGVTRQVYRANA